MSKPLMIQAKRRSCTPNRFLPTLWWFGQPRTTILAFGKFTQRHFSPLASVMLLGLTRLAAKNAP